MKKQSTIRDVAGLAGVSTSTVSVALNSTSKVRLSPELRDRVMSAVKTLDYRPTVVGRPANFERSSKPQSAQNKIVVLIDGIYSRIDDSIYGQVCQGIELELRNFGADVVLLSEDSYSVPFETSGIIVIGKLSEEKKRLVGKLPWIQAMDMIDPSTSHDHVTYDNLEMARAAAQYLIPKHQVIGCLCNQGKDFFVQRGELFGKLIKAAGQEFIPVYGEGVDFYSPDLLENALKQMFSGKRQVPTALFIMSDYITSMVYPVLYNLGIKPGREVEIVTCDNDYHRISLMRPTPTVIDICAFEIGRVSAMQLSSRLRHPNLMPLKLEVKPRLIPAKEWHNNFKLQLVEVKK